MEIPYQIYTWLKDCNFLTSSYEPSNHIIPLSEQDSQKLELGLILPLFPQLISNLPKDSDFQKNNSKVSRLNNWNLLIRPLEALNIPLTSDTKALIVAGDRQQVSEILQALFKSLLILNKKQGLGASYDGSLLLNNLNTLIQLTETNSVLEFLVLSFCKAFKVSGKVAVGLLAQNGAYLAQLIKKGLKGVYDPVLTWLSLIENNFEHSFKLVKRESASIGLVLNLIKFCLLSNSEIVQDRCLQVFFNVLSVLGIENENLAHQWFVDSNVINEVFWYLENRIDVVQGVKFIKLYSIQNYEIFWVELNQLCKDNLRYLKLTQKILPCFVQLNAIHDIFNNGLVSCWIDMCLHGSAGENKGKGLYVMFICDIWGCFIDYFVGQEELSNNIITFIKRILRDSTKGLKLMCLGQVFEIFSIFSMQHVKYAPILYKILIFTLTEHFENFPIREFIFLNFSRIIKEDLTIPLANLVEAVVKQALQLKNNNFQIFDLDFYIALSRHPSLSLKEAILLVDLCSKLLTIDSIFSSAAEIPFLIISSRFVEFLAYQDYLAKFVSLILNIKQNSKFYMEKLKSKNVKLVNLIEKIVGLGSTEFNNKLRKMFEYVMTDIKNIREKSLENLFFTLFDHRQSALVPVSEQRYELTAASIMTNTPVRAMYHIEKIRQQREQKELMVKMKTEQKSLKNIIEKLSLKQELKKRRIELGVKSRLDDEELLILDKPSLPDKFAKFTMIRDEFPETQKLLKSVFKKYRRVNRSLFSKYAGLAYKNIGSMTPSFDRYKNKKLMLTEGDFSLFLKQFNILGNKMTVKEMKKIFATLCKNSIKTVSVEDFHELIYMACSLIAHKNPMLSKLPEVLSLFDFYFNLEKCCEGLVPKNFFNEPDPGYADRDVVKALNEKLEKDPEMELNENYKKYEEIVVMVKYDVPVGRKSQKMVLRILDQLFCDTFNFHFLLPTVKILYKTRAKGILKAEDPRFGLGYLNKIESNPEFFKLSTHIKIHALNLDYSENILIECSKLVDDLIFTIEKNSNEVISRLPKPAGSISNKFIQNKYFHEVEKTFEHERIEEKRKYRAKTLEKIVEKNKMDKEWRDIVEAEHKVILEKTAKLQEYEQRKQKKLKKLETDKIILSYKQKKIEEVENEKKLKAKEKKNKQKQMTEKKKLEENLVKVLEPATEENSLKYSRAEKPKIKDMKSDKSFLSKKIEAIKPIVSMKFSSKDQKSFLNNSQDYRKSSSVPKNFSHLFKRN